MYMMSYHPISRNQRPKGLTIKQALQFALLLAVGIWLLYQIKRSRRNIDDSTLRKLNEERGSNVFGRKMVAGWSNNSDGSSMYTKDVNLLAEIEKKKADSGEWDELNKDPKESHVYEDSNHIFEVRRDVEAASMQEMRNDEDHERKNEDPRKSDANYNFTLPDGSDEAVNAKKRNGLLEQLDGLENTTNSVTLLHGNNENVQKNEESDGIQSFPDENGVPMDPNDESFETESTEFDSQSRMVRSMPIEDLSSGALDSDLSSDTVDGRDTAFANSTSVSS